MKSLIKKLVRESLLTEKVMNINHDVDYIYDAYFKNNINEINSTGFVRKDMFKQYISTTDVFTDELTLKANKINPCKIKINYGNNFYRPSEQLISISINFNAFNYAFDYNGNLKQAKENLPVSLGKSFMQEFTEEKIKGSIHHELAHWLDDSFHNRHIEKFLNMSKPIKHINTHHLELQAQIHNIIQLKRKNEDLWDLLSFDELIHMSPTLYVIYNELPYSERNNWIKNLKRRMYREGLLGKEMFNTNKVF